MRDNSLAVIDRGLILQTIFKENSNKKRYNGLKTRAVFIKLICNRLQIML